jgi:hypothetical protein
VNIKPNKASTRDYRKGYLMGGVIDEQGISHGSANEPGGTIQTGGPGVYDPSNPQAGAQGWSTLNPEGSLGELGHTQFGGDYRKEQRPDKDPQGPRSMFSPGM